MSARTALDSAFITKSITKRAFALSLPLRSADRRRVSFSDLLCHTLSRVPAHATLVRWPDAAGIVGIDTRRVLDLIVSGELDPFRLPDDL